MTPDAQLYRKGFVVLPRSRRYPSTKRDRRSRVPEPPGFTLHREGCGYVQRSPSRMIPAPADPYPGTVDCPYCKPSLNIEGLDNGNT